ncbi:unnamed protein product, partial [Ectocarpus sp. 12 AP-2014]
NASFTILTGYTIEHQRPLAGVLLAERTTTTPDHTNQDSSQFGFSACNQIHLGRLDYFKTNEKMVHFSKEIYTGQIEQQLSPPWFADSYSNQANSNAAVACRIVPQPVSFQT